MVSYLLSTDAAQVTLDLGSRARVGCGGTEREEATSQSMGCVWVGRAKLRRVAARRGAGELNRAASCQTGKSVLSS